MIAGLLSALVQTNARIELNEEKKRFQARVSSSLLHTQGQGQGQILFRTLTGALIAVTSAEC